MGRGQGGRIFVVAHPFKPFVKQSEDPIAGAKIRLLKLIRIMQFKEQRSTQHEVLTDIKATNVHRFYLR